MQLYHGTTSKAAQAIMKNGVGVGESIFLSSDVAQAMYYAEVAVDESGGAAAVLLVDVDPRQALCVADGPSVEEPLTYTLKTHGKDENSWGGFVDDVTKKAAELAPWKVSLYLTQSIKVMGPLEGSSFILSGGRSNEADVEIVDTCKEVAAATMSRSVEVAKKQGKKKGPR
jgi:hypothetical protein